MVDDFAEPQAPSNHAVDAEAIKPESAPGNHVMGQQKIEIAIPREFAGRLSPADIIVVIYLFIIASLITIFHSSIEHGWALVLLHGLIITVIISMARRQRIHSSQFLYILRCWYPLILLFGSYKELTYIVHRINPAYTDWKLAAIDRYIFGVDPTLWLQRITFPVTTELLQLSYICYYFFPLILGLMLWHRRSYRRFHFFVFIVVLGFYLSYIGYITVPAIGPRFILTEVYSIPLSGVLTFQWIRNTIDLMEGITPDCFPSGHTELTILILSLSWRFRRKAFWWMVLPGTALIFSTVYLRYHYVIDVVAGAALALIIILLGDWLFERISGKKVDETEGSESQAAIILLQ